MKNLQDTALTSLGRHLDEPASDGPGATSQPSVPQLNGESRFVPLAVSPPEQVIQDLITSHPSWHPAQASQTGVSSSSGFWHPQTDGRSFVLPATTLKQEESEKNVSYQGHNVKIEETAQKFMDENQELFQDLTKLEEKEKSESLVESVAREFMRDNHQLMSNLARLEEQEKLPKQSEPSQTGRKNDLGKPQLDLIPVEALNALGEALAYGARKYDRANWAKGIQQSRLLAATLRHVSAYSSGQDLDPESGLSHVSHALCNLAFLAYMIKNRSDMDDRWSK